MPERTPFVLRNAKEFLVTPTYDGSGVAVHPDVVYFEKAWHGYKYWLVFTPYPGGHAYHGNPYENPCILAGNNGSDWEVPPGLANPLVAAPPGACPTREIPPPPTSAPGRFSHNCDPDMVYNDDTDELWVYYLEGIESLGDEATATLKLLTSKNGMEWSEPQALMRSPFSQAEARRSPTCDNARSPAIVKQGRLWHMWCEIGRGDDNRVEYRRSDDGMNWSHPQKVELAQQGYAPWHLDVIYVPSKAEYWVLFSGYPICDPRPGTEKGMFLFFATSKDGLKWVTYDNPVLGPGPGWDSGMIYRPTFLFDVESDGKVRVWYSVVNKDDECRIGYTASSFVK